MKYLFKLSIKSKLIFILVCISALATGSVGYFAHSNGKQAMTEAVFKQLTSVRTTKARQIEDYVKGIRNHVASLAESHMFTMAMSGFVNGFTELEGTTIEPVQTNNVAEYYSNEILVRLASHVGGEPQLNSFMPRDKRSLYLQDYYIASNPHPIGEKATLDSADDGSAYSKVHQRYHPLFRRIVKRFGYYDMFLIDARTADVVYTVSKDTDFARNLQRGAYTNNGLSRVYESVMREPDRGFIAIEDFTAYRPSYGAPAAFMASPIFDGADLVGILAIQLPTDEINYVMTGTRQWQEDGLGETGETYIVGQDHLMRSDSRFLIEHPDEYLQTLQDAGVNQQKISRIRDFGTTILQQEVRTDAVSAAMVGKRGTEIILDYRGVTVLSSFAPLNIDGLSWVIISEIDFAEANLAVASFSRLTLLLVLLVVLLVTGAAMWVGESFTSPLRSLILEARQIAKGDLDRFGTHYPVDFGNIAQSFNEMLGRVGENATEADAQIKQYDQLLAKMLPRHIATKLLEGESPVVQRHSNVSVLFAEIIGFSRLADTTEPEAYATLLNDLIDELDESARKNGVEKIKSNGCDYLAVSGLSVVRLDHASCTMVFAKSIFAIVSRFNRNHRLKLGLRIGIASGTVVASVIGRSRIVYDLTG
ncbi:MAG: hypothetical protein ACI81A_001568, partial [Paraglaciecola sp.]